MGIIVRIVARILAKADSVGKVGRRSAEER